MVVSKFEENNKGKKITPDGERKEDQWPVRKIL